MARSLGTYVTQSLATLCAIAILMLAAGVAVLLAEGPMREALKNPYSQYGGQTGMALIALAIFGGASLCTAAVLLARLDRQ